MVLNSCIHCQQKMALNNPLVLLLIEINHWSLKREFEDAGWVICEHKINFVLKDIE